jgi:hypothetical protein
MIFNIDHFTPLSRAVASIDRDAYAARFAVYDREHKALLRRLAAAAPVSDADVAREEQAFREAIRRIEFGDEDDQPTLVPADEPVEEASPEPRLAAWPPPRAPSPETGDDGLDAVVRPVAPEVPGVSSLDHLEPGIVGAPVIRLSEPRSLARRVGERLAIAALLLVFAGVGLWMGDERQDAATDPSVGRAVAESTQPAPADDGAEAKAQQPNWLSPEMFYSPMMPPPSSPPAAAAAPRADVPLPTPRPDR